MKGDRSDTVMTEFWDKKLREIENDSESLYRQLNYCLKFLKCPEQATLDLFCSDARAFAYSMNLTIRAKMAPETFNLIRTRPQVEVYRFYARCAESNDEYFLKLYREAFPAGQDRVLEKQQSSGPNR